MSSDSKIILDILHMLGAISHRATESYMEMHQ
jgi:hypothetical protein